MHVCKFYGLSLIKNSLVGVQLSVSKIVSHCFVRTLLDVDERSDLPDGFQMK